MPYLVTVIQGSYHRLDAHRWGGHWNHLEHDRTTRHSLEDGKEEEWQSMSSRVPSECVQAWLTTFATATVTGVNR